MCEKLDIKMTQIPDWNCCGGTLKEAGLDGHIIQPKKLQEIAVKVVPGKR